MKILGSTGAGHWDGNTYLGEAPWCPRPKEPDYADGYEDRAERDLFHTPPVEGAFMFRSSKKQAGVLLMPIPGEGFSKGFYGVVRTKSGRSEIEDGDWLKREGEFFIVYKNLDRERQKNSMRFE